MRWLALELVHDLVQKAVQLGEFRRRTSIDGADAADVLRTDFHGGLLNDDVADLKDLGRDGQVLITGQALQDAANQRRSHDLELLRLGIAQYDRWCVWAVFVRSRDWPPEFLTHR